MDATLPRSVAAQPNEQNLDVLRRILPHCDVLVYVATAQKYKTQAVTAELLRHAPGRQIVFVQTHAALDADITADWQQQLTMQGFSVPRTFRVDSEAALERAEQHRPLPAEFAALVDFLMSELAGRAGHRILRTNAVDLLAWFVNQAQHDIEAASSAVIKLEEATAAQRERLLDTVRQRRGRSIARQSRFVALAIASRSYAPLERRAVYGFLASIGVRTLGTPFHSGHACPQPGNAIGHRWP